MERFISVRFVTPHIDTYLVGKRAAPNYDFGLGKRDLDNFEREPLKMKRQVEPSWLRKRFAFGLGKRAPYGFGLGK